MIITRFLTAADYETVHALWTAAGLHIRPVGRDGREAFAAQIESGCQVVIGLEDADRPVGDGRSSRDRLVGVVLATSDSRRGWINRLAVHPDYRRQGLGLRLIHEAERVLKEERGLHVISAHIESWNESSLALFAEAGYVQHEDVLYFSKRDRQDV